VPDIYRLLLQQADSLLLAPDQAKALTEARARYRVPVDSVWATLASYLVALPSAYDRREALLRQEEATATVWELTRRESATIRAILSPLQLRLAPVNVRYVLEAEGPITIRSVVR
jgi:hypothetical protein